MAFAGLDVGTSGVKLLVYDLDGAILFTASRKYEELGSGGRRELNPETVMKNVKEVLREAGENCPEKIEPWLSQALESRSYAWTKRAGCWPIQC